MKKERIYIKDLQKHISEEVLIKGWVNIRRDQGKMIFLDFRDMTGVVQGVVLPQAVEAIETGKKLRTEFVVAITGKVNERPERNKKAGILNGDIELEILHIEILAEAATLPFDISESGLEIDEMVRLEHRYVDLRRARLQKNIRNRFHISQLVRKELETQGFCEVETPLMSAPTPEGSRSYIIPSRLHKGKFYALPQSPQQYKQLLMVGGFEKYFQFARCMRDEDTRGDRQPEFTQLDMEMSFVEPEDVMNLNEQLLIKVVTELYPEKRIQQIPFPRMTYKEAMDTYGNDRPDIREDKTDANLLAFLWVTDFPAFEKTGADNLDGTGEWTFTHNPFAKPQEKSMGDFRNKTNIADIVTTQYDITMNGFEIGGGSVRHHSAVDQKTTFEIMGYSDEKIEENFGHILKALTYGAPPHGGIAWGFDRLVMLLENEPNIREVIAFAKTGEGRDLMMGAPIEVSRGQLGDLGLKV